MELLKTIKKDDFNEIISLLHQVDYDVNQLDVISPAYVSQEFCEFDIFIGEGYPYYIQIPIHVFSNYAEEYFQSDILPWIKDDAEFKIALRAMETVDHPLEFWYNEISDKRDKTEMSKYVAKQLFMDILSERGFSVAS